MAGITPRAQGQIFEEQTVTANDFAQTSQNLNTPILDTSKSATPHFSHTVTQSDLDFLELTGLEINLFNFFITNQCTKTAVTTLSDLIHYAVDVNSVEVFTDSEAVSDSSTNIYSYFRTGITPLTVGDFIEVFFWSPAGASIFQYNASKIIFVPHEMTVTAQLISFLEEEDEQVSSDHSYIDDFTFNSAPTFNQQAFSYEVNGDNGSGLWKHDVVLMRGKKIFTSHWASADGGGIFDTTSLSVYICVIENLKYIRAII